MTAPSKTGLVVVTHGTIGQAMIEVAEFILGQTLDDVRFVPFQQSSMAETGDAEILQAVRLADQGQGVLVMTDICGASPYNTVAGNISRLGSEQNVVMTCGLNLAMLIRVWNYRDRPPADLAKLASDGAVRDIRECQS